MVGVEAPIISRTIRFVASKNTRKTSRSARTLRVTNEGTYKIGGSFPVSLKMYLCSNESEQLKERIHSVPVPLGAEWIKDPCNSCNYMLFLFEKEVLCSIPKTSLKIKKPEAQIVWSFLWSVSFYPWLSQYLYPNIRPFLVFHCFQYNLFVSKYVSSLYLALRKYRTVG